MIRMIIIITITIHNHTGSPSFFFSNWDTRTAALCAGGAAVILVVVGGTVLVPAVALIWHRQINFLRLQHVVSFS